MCTSIRFTDNSGHMYLGRNLDWSFDYGQQVRVMPRGFHIPYSFIDDASAAHAVIGMCIDYKNYPMFFDCGNDAGLAVDVVCHMAQDLQRAEHHGDVAVVAAGVHAALVDAGEILAGLLGDGQGVDIRTQQDAAARRAVLAIGVGRGAAKGRHQARLKGTLVGDIHGVELVGDVRSRALFGEAQLRVLMEVPLSLIHI